jgi:hypothetical protein
MATKRPAKLAIGKKVQKQKICPETGKPMIATKVIRTQGGSSMRWVVVDDFDGSEKALARVLPIR